MFLQERTGVCSLHEPECTPVHIGHIWDREVDDTISSEMKRRRSHIDPKPLRMDISFWEFTIPNALNMTYSIHFTRFDTSSMCSLSLEPTRNWHRSRLRLQRARWTTAPASTARATWDTVDDLGTRTDALTPERYGVGDHLLQHSPGNESSVDLAIWIYLWKR